MFNVRDFYHEKSGEWDDIRDRSLIESRWIDKIFDYCPDRPKVLDAGCGAGEPISGYLIEKGCQLSGIDIAPAMIDVCRKRFPEATWHCGDVQSMRINEAFDAIIAWDWLFHLDRTTQQRALESIVCHLEPGGVLLFTTGAEEFEIVADFMGRDVYHASLDPNEYKLMLDSLNVNILEYAIRDPDCTFHNVWLVQKSREREA